MILMNLSAAGPLWNPRAFLQAWVLATNGLLVVPCTWYGREGWGGREGGGTAEHALGFLDLSHMGNRPCA